MRAARITAGIASGAILAGTALASYGLWDLSGRTSPSYLVIPLILIGGLVTINWIVLHDATTTHSAWRRSLPLLVLGALCLIPTSELAAELLQRTW